MSNYKILILVISTARDHQLTSYVRAIANDSCDDDKRGFCKARTTSSLFGPMWQVCSPLRQSELAAQKYSSDTRLANSP